MLDVTMEEAKQAAIDEVVQDAVMPIIQTNVDMYGTTGLYDHTPSVNLINQLLGEDYLNDLRELDEDVTNTLSNREENLGSEEAIKLHWERLRTFGASMYKGQMLYLGEKRGIYTLSANGTRNYKY